MTCRATQDRWVMVESSDKMWSTGEGNGKPLQYSCLENPMNSMNSMNGIGTYGSYICNFLRNHNIFHSGCTILYSPQFDSQFLLILVNTYHLS